MKALIHRLTSAKKFFSVGIFFLLILSIGLYILFFPFIYVRQKNWREMNEEKPRHKSKKENTKKYSIFKDKMEKKIK